MNIFANDVSAYLANILCSLIGDLDFMMLCPIFFYLKWQMIQESEITESFDLELLFTNILADTALQVCLAETGEWSKPIHLHDKNT